MQIEINANNFSNLEEFYDEIENKFINLQDFKFGRNLDAFHDILCGGFGVFDYDEFLELVWIDSNKSKLDLNEKHKNKRQTIFDIIIEIIEDYDHIKLILK